MSTKLEEIVERAVYKAVKKFLLNEGVLEKLLESVVASSVKLLEEQRSASVANNTIQKEKQNKIVSKVAKTSAKERVLSKEREDSRNVVTPEKLFGKYGSVIDESILSTARKMKTESEVSVEEPDVGTRDSYYEFSVEKDAITHTGHADSKEYSSLAGMEEFQKYQRSIMEESVSVEDIMSLLGK